MEPLFSKRGRVPILLQTEVAECGLACLAMVAGYHGHRTDLGTLRREIGVSPRGANLKDILNAAATLKLSTRPLRLELSELPQLKTPAILHWDFSHFVVLVATTRNAIIVHDPAVGRRRFDLKEAGRRFTGVAVELTPTTDFETRSNIAVTRLSELFTRSSGFYRLAGQVLFLSIIVQILSIAGPFYLQLIIDQSLARHDLDLLKTIALGFLLIALFRVFATALRSYVVMYLTNQVGFQMATNVFNHLISLPADYFERRHVGDVVSRFGSIGAIRKVLTEDMISVLLDGVLAVLTLIVLFMYSVKLTFIILGFVAAFSLYRMATLASYKNKQEEVVVAEARQQSIFMENMRAIHAIKAYCKELPRMAIWKNSFVDVINSGVRLQRFSIGVESVNLLLFAVENILILYLAARLVMGGELTIGMLISFAFMKGHFETAVGSTIKRIADIKLVKLQLERVSDITQTPREINTLSVSPFKRDFHGAIEMRDLKYGYSAFERPIFAGVCLQVERGALVIITGASGSGKSTLLRLMAGLLRPSAGEILVDGLSIAQIGYREYRSQISTVLQSSQLMSGSLTENIAMFDEFPDMEKVHRAAQLALIHDEIMAMPMGYNSFIGDMGSIISAGQAQRVLIARAIYNDPKLLLLDEAMSNLDFELEASILRNLKSLGMTIVMITHRTNLHDMGNQLYRMEKGRLVQPQPASPPLAAV